MLEWYHRMEDQTLGQQHRLKRKRARKLREFEDKQTTTVEQVAPPSENYNFQRPAISKHHSVPKSTSKRELAGVKAPKRSGRRKAKRARGDGIPSASAYKALSDGITEMASSTVPNPASSAQSTEPHGSNTLNNIENGVCSDIDMDGNVMPLERPQGGSEFDPQPTWEGDTLEQILLKGRQRKPRASNQQGIPALVLQCSKVLPMCVDKVL